MLYRPEIDGLRAVAIIPVVLFHAGFGAFSGGYVGVDVFFVISGYLITSILIEDLENGGLSLGRFYERRARRILPALVLVLICTSIVAWFWMLPSQYEDYSRSLAAVALFVSNVYFWRGESYFAPATELSPLLHTWSLSVEEQFYLVFPLLLLGMWRLRGRLIWVLVGLSIASLLLAESKLFGGKQATFYLLPTRAWELGAGAICAVALRDAPIRSSGILSTAGLLLILTSVFVYDETVPFPSLYTLLPVGGSVLVILYAGAGTPAARLLALPGMVGIGLVSYSAYLWHQPLFAMARIRAAAEPSTFVMLLLALAAFGLAYVTWRLVELPFRRRARPILPSRGWLFAAAGASTAALLGVGLHGQASDGRYEAWAEANPAAAPVYALHQVAVKSGGFHVDLGGCRFSVGSLDTPTRERLRACRESHGLGVAVFGDSHAFDLFDGLAAMQDDGFVFGLTINSCWVGLTAPNCDFGRFAALLRDEPGLFRTVIYHQAGYRFISVEDGSHPSNFLESLPVDADLSREPVSIASERFDDGLPDLAAMSQYANIVWLGPRIEPSIGVNALIQGGCDHPYRLRPGQAELYQEIDRRLAAAAKAAGVAYTSLIQAVQFDVATDFISCPRRLYWRDGDHWSNDGAKLFVGRLLAREPQLRASLGAGTRSELRTGWRRPG